MSQTTSPNPEVRAYCATPGPFTDLTDRSAAIRDLPTALDDLCRVVQGLIVHPFLAHLYGTAPDEHRREELEIRPAAGMLKRILELDLHGPALHCVELSVDEMPRLPLFVPDFAHPMILETRGCKYVPKPHRARAGTF